MKQLKFALLILVPVLILVIIRSVNTNHFKPDAKKLAEPSVMRSNLISNEEMAATSGKILLINLDEGGAVSTGIGSNTEVLNITPDAILEKSTIKKLTGFKGKVVLVSTDVSVSARMWMFLSQMGIENLYILTSDKENESFKNKFRPDTLTRPEL
ncbi:MAG: hypothetical protein IPH69_14540 [Bacteroidales bacterium]|nr:hypothetical protein [Bacteroidales bacterium]